jgi:DNA polymerase alpha-associated DNA helicase A
MTASPEDLARFLARHKELLSRERLEEIERTSLLLSKASQKALEQNGLALGGLGVASMGIGLGGKTYATLCSLLHNTMLTECTCRLVELERPSAYHSTPMFPPHTFR